jgi:hypothetical protein
MLQCERNTLKVQDFLKKSLWCLKERKKMKLMGVR